MKYEELLTSPCAITEAHGPFFEQDLGDPISNIYSAMETHWVSIASLSLPLPILSHIFYY